MMIKIKKNFGIYLKNEKKAIIIGIKGLQLNRIEKKILSKEHPWGVILFEKKH